MNFIPEYDKLVQIEKQRIEWWESVEITSKHSDRYEENGTVIAIIPASNGFPELYEVRFSDGKADTFDRKQVKKPY